MAAIAEGSNNAPTGEDDKSANSDVAKTTTETNENLHQLQDAYTFWYMKRGQKNSAESYEDSIKQISSFNTIEQFWKIYSHIIRPGDPGSEKPMDYILFKKGIKPMWEDENNKRGGKWVVRIPKKVSAYYWESILLAVIGEQFDVGDEICGCVLSVRFSEDVISIWNRDCSNKVVLTRIRDIMRRVLKLPGQVQMDYRRHDTALADVGVDGGATVNNSNNNSGNGNNSSGWSTAGGNQNQNNNHSRGSGYRGDRRGGNNPTRGDRRGAGPRMNRNSSGSGAPSGRWR
jgi:translation initiation factor 4E